MNFQLQGEAYDSQHFHAQERADKTNCRDTRPLLACVDHTLAQQRYALDTIQKYLHAADAFGRWVAAQQLPLVAISEDTLAHYETSLPRRTVRSCPKGVPSHEVVERPYLGFRLNLDSSLVASVMMESGIELKKGDARLKAMDVSPMDSKLLDAVVRLVRLLDEPAEGKVLAPLIIREIVFRLLAGEQIARLSHLLAAGKDTHLISKAISLLRKNFDELLKMDDLAHELGISVSGFHHHFKSVTAMSPLQFQKQIRLQEARRLRLGEDLDAASAGFRVGYEDPAYFSREYKKLFGAPPQRDITKLCNNLEL